MVDDFMRCSDAPGTTKEEEEEPIEEKDFESKQALCFAVFAFHSAEFSCEHLTINT